MCPVDIALASYTLSYIQGVAQNNVLSCISKKSRINFLAYMYVRLCGVGVM